MSKKKKKNQPEEPHKPRIEGIKLDLLFLGAIFILVFFFFREIILGKNQIWEDLIEFLYPLRNFAAVSLREGRIPFWCPYIFGGMPFLAEPQTAIFYPLNLIFALFVRNGHLPYRILELQVVLHFFIAGALMYIVLRAKKLSNWASFSGAVVFTFSAFLVFHVIHGNIINTVAWFPGLFYLMERAFDHPRLRETAFYSLGLFFVSLAGYPQLIVYWILFQGFYFLWRIGTERTLIISRTAVMFISVGLFYLLWMWQLKSTSFMVNFTERKVLTFSASAENSIPLLQLPQRLFLPEFFGMIHQNISPPPYFWGGPSWGFWETAIFVGLTSLLLAAIALQVRLKDKRIVFFGVSAVLAIILAAGKYGLLYWIIYKLIPPIRRFRIPPRFASFLSLSVAILAAYGFDSLQQVKTNTLKWILKLLAVAIIVGFSIVLFSLNTPSTPVGLVKRTYMLRSSVRLIAVSLILILIFWSMLKGVKRFVYLIPVIIFIELYSFGHIFPLSDIDAESYYSEANLPRFIRQDKGVYRINIRKKNTPPLLPRNIGPVIGREIVDGYEVLRLDRYARLYSNIPRPIFFDLLDVKYFVEDNKKPKYAAFKLNEDRLGRGFFVKNVKVLPEDSILKRFENGWQGYRDTALVESDIFTHSFSDSASIKIINVKGGDLKARITAKNTAFLVLSEVWFPERKVFIDGKETPVYPVDLSLMGVVIPKGKHTLELKYVPDSFRKGMLLTILGLFIAIVFIFVPQDKIPFMSKSKIDKK